MVIPWIGTMSTGDQQQYRYRRAWLNFFSDVKQTDITAKGSSSINMHGAIDHGNGTRKVTGPWLHMVKNQTGRIMEGGTDFILTPVTWITNLTTYWYE